VQADIYFEDRDEDILELKEMYRIPHQDQGRLGSRQADPELGNHVHGTEPEIHLAAIYEEVADLRHQVRIPPNLPTMRYYSTDSASLGNQNMNYNKRKKRSSIITLLLTSCDQGSYKSMKNCIPNLRHLPVVEIEEAVDMMLRW
jgi:hypothetical protein